jgi:choice-of-anchor A domain-containing protein
LPAASLLFATTIVTPFATVRAQNLGAAANYVLLGLANGTVIVDSGTAVAGDFGYSAGTTSTNQKLGNDALWLGTAYVHSQVASFQAAANFLPSGGIVTNAAEDARLDQANLDAVAASAYVASLPATETLGDIVDQSVTLGSVDGLHTVHIVDVTSLLMNSDVLHLIGDATDVFVFNVRGDFRFSQSEVLLSGGITAANVLFNFPVGGNYTRNVLVNKSATIFNGTMLAPDLNGFELEYHNPASFHGAIIARRIDVHSDFNLNHEPFTGCVCTGPAAIADANFPSCGSPLDPVLTSTRPVLGSTLTLHVTSQLPNALLLLAASPGAPLPFQFPGSECTAWVDVTNFFVASVALTDANGSWTFTAAVPAECIHVGRALTVQTTILDPAVPGPIPGFPFWLSNAVYLALGVP